MRSKLDDISHHPMIRSKSMLLSKGCRRLFSARSPINTRQSVGAIKQQLEKWLQHPKQWNNDQRIKVIRTVFQTYDMDPSAVDPTPYLERWRRENGHDESEAASIFQKFRSHGSPMVASVLLRTRLQFLTSAEEAVAIAKEFLSRHPQNEILYSILLHRLTELENADELILRELKSRNLRDTICFNIALRHFYKDSETIFKIVSIMKEMKVTPDSHSYEQLVHTYLHGKAPEKAVHSVVQIQDASVLAQATLQILKYYRDIVTVPSISITDKHQAVQAATKLCDYILPKVNAESKGTKIRMSQRISPFVGQSDCWGFLWIHTYIWAKPNKLEYCLNRSNGLLQTRLPL